MLHDPAGPVGNLTQKTTVPGITGFGEGRLGELFFVNIDFAKGGSGELRQVTAA